MPSAVKYLMSLKEPVLARGQTRPQILESNGNIQYTWDGAAGQEGDEPAAMVGFSSGQAAEAMRAIAADKRDAAFAEELAIRYPQPRRRPSSAAALWTGPPRHGRLLATLIRLPAR